MAVLSAAAAISHAPGLTGWIGVAPETDQETVVSSFEEIRRVFREAGTDVVVLVGNDHVNNARLNNFPDFTVGAATHHRGPDEWFKPWLKVPDYELTGDPSFARYLGDRAQVSNHTTRTVEENLRFDDNLSVPATLLRMAETEMRVVPILQNCTVPPIPDQRASYAFGQRLREAIDSYPDELRVALLGSGGMSHEPGGPRYLEIDEKFDRWFLDLLSKGNHEEILEQATLARMEEAGSGGTAELLSWIAVMAAAGPESECRPLGYAAVDEWRCGFGAVVWNV